MFRLTINIGSTADVFVARSASRVFRNLSLPSPSVQGPVGDGGYATRLRYDETADGGRARYLLLLTEGALPPDQRQHLVARLEAGLSGHFDRLLHVPNLKVAEADIADVYQFCEALEAELASRPSNQKRAKKKATAPSSEKKGNDFKVDKGGISKELRFGHSAPEQSMKSGVYSDSANMPVPGNGGAPALSYAIGLVGVFALLVAGSAWWNVRALRTSFDTQLAQRFEEIEREFTGTRQSLGEMKLLERVGTLGTQISKLEKENGAANVDLLAARATVGAVLAEIERLDDATGNVSKKLETVVRKSAVLNDAISEVEFSIQSTSRKFNETVSDIEGGVRKQAKASVNELTAIKEELQRILSQRNSLEDELAPVAERIAALSSQVREGGDLDKKVATLSNLVSALERESAVVKELQGKLADVSSALAILEGEVIEATPKSAALREEIGSYLSEWQDLVEMVDQIRSRDGTAAQMAELSVSILNKNATLESEIQSIQERLKTAIADLERDFDALPPAIEEIESELETIQNRATAGERVAPRFGADGLTSDDISIAQTFLDLQGYQVGPIDGIAGSGTRRIASDFLALRVQFLIDQQLLDQPDLNPLGNKQMVALLLNFLAVTKQLPRQ